MKYKNLAEHILVNVGGKENVNSLVHCVTRLRFQVKNDSIVNVEALNKTDGVLKVVISGGQHQIIIGNHVPEVFKAVNEVMGGQVVSDTPKTSSNKKTNLFDKFIDMIAGIFTPTLGVLSAAGMIKGLVALLVALKVLAPDSGTYAILNATGDAFFVFLPVVLGYTAALKFGLNKFTGIGIAAALLYPALGTIQPGATLFGLPLMMPMGGYGSTVMPILFAVYFASKVQNLFESIIPKVVSVFLVPFFTLLVVTPITFLAIGPVTVFLSGKLGAGTMGLIALSPIIAGAFLGGFWQVFVMFGLHWGLIPIAINNMMTMGQDKILVAVLPATFAQIGVLLAIILKTKDPKVKSIGIPAFVSGIFGVTEPAIYGVTLPRKRPFIISCIVAAIFGGAIAVFGTTTYRMGGLGVFAYPSYIPNEGGFGMGFWGAIICTVGAFVVGFIAQLLFGGKEKEVKA